jgi:hypothetical protein
MSNTPERGRGWPEEVKARALALLAEHRNASKAREHLIAELGAGNVPARNTLVGWAKAAGIALTNVDPNKAVATGSATKTRTELDAAARVELSRAIRDRLSRPAVELLARRLVEAEDDERVYKLARRSFLDRVEMEAHAADLGDDELRAAKVTTAQARRELVAAGELRLSTLDLVRIATYGVRDHLKLEGAETDADGFDRGPITVVFDIPDEQAHDEREVTTP